MITITCNVNVIVQLTRVLYTHLCVQIHINRHVHVDVCLHIHSHTLIHTQACTRTCIQT